MLVSSNQPGVQFYTANFFPDKGASVDERIVGKGGTMYKKHDAFCLETQNWPDFINHVKTLEYVTLCAAKMLLVFF